MAGDKFTLSITILLTGFAVVFAVLLLLIGIIKLYGTIIYSVQNKPKAKKAAKNAAAPAPVDAQPVPVAVIEADATEDDDELIAVISAAVYSVYSASEVRIKSIRKAPSRTNSWRNAGLYDNIRPF